MSSKVVLFFFVLFLPAVALPPKAQAQFATQGTITFDRKYNLGRAMRWESMYKNFKQYADKLPKNMHSTFILKFNKQKSAYTFQEDPKANDGDNWLLSFVRNNGMANKNQVYTHFQKDSSESLKKVFESTFLIADSLPKFRWKIEDRIRMIAGYPCRKAITTICDSVVVVAFYTDRIMPSGGPEGFNGLPGMILGIAIPRLYLTWFATDVTTTSPEFTKPDFPKKAKEVSRKAFLNDISKATSRFGRKSQKLLWRISL